MNQLTGELPQALAVLPGSSPLFPPSYFLSHRTLNGSGDVENGNLCEGECCCSSCPPHRAQKNRPAKRKISRFPSLILPGANIHEEESREKKKRRRKKASGHSAEWIRSSLAVLLQRQQLAAQLGGKEWSGGGFFSDSFPQWQGRGTLFNLCCVLPQKQRIQQSVRMNLGDEHFFFYL